MLDSEELCHFNEISTLISSLLKPLIWVQRKYGKKKKKKTNKQKKQQQKKTQKTKKKQIKKKKKKIKK